VKIKTQGILLFAGIVLLPFFTLAAEAFLLRFAGRQERIPMPMYEEIVPYLNENMTKHDWEKIVFRLSHSRQGADMVILTTDFRILFSTIGELPQGQTVNEQILISRLKEKDGRYNYVAESFPKLDENLFLLTRFDHSGKTSSPMVTLALVFFIAIGVTILFVLFVIVGIIRSVTSSVTMLEKATRRIVSGEFDLDVDIKGSNEISSLGNSLNTMRLKLKENMLRRSRFVMGVSHDLKTPLALIRGYAEAIGDGIDKNPGSLERSTSIITSKVKQLEDMIDDLLDVVKLDSEEYRGMMNHIPLAEYLEKFGREIKQDSEIFYCTVETKIDIDPGITVRMDNRLVNRALLNIVNNAIRYSGKNSCIRFTAFMQNGKAHIEISDNGPGIKSEDLSHIFETFYRGTSSRREQGPGLGLAMVKGVIDSHGWEINVRSVEASPAGQSGTTFEIEIPILA
jgi:signal transduction histidine kinase